MEDLWGPSVGWMGNFVDTIRSYDGPIFQTTLGEDNAYQLPSIGEIPKNLILPKRIYFHSPHTVNLGKDDNRGRGILQSLLNKVAVLLKDDETLKIGVVAHIGRGQGSTLDNTIEKVRTLSIPDGVVLYLENSAGAGYELGYNFEQLEELFRPLPRKIKLCIDTQHSFASGLARWQSDDDVSTFVDQINEYVPKRLKLFHLNDSKKPYLSRVDRHEKIGQGYIWGTDKEKEGLRSLLETSLDNQIPMILETPDSQGDLLRLIEMFH